MSSFALSNDFTQNASTFVLALPVKRSNIFFGRFLAATTISAAVTLAFYVFIALESNLYYGAIQSTLVSSYILSLLLIINVMALVFLFSGLLKMDRLVLVGSFFILFLLIPVLTGIFQMYSININSLLSYDSLAISRLIGPFGITVYSFSFIPVTVKLNYLNMNFAIISMSLYFVILFIIGITIYGKKQIV